MTKFFYIVDHYVPFPSSEYGGIWNVIAEDDDECFDLITGADDGDFNSKFYGHLRENILKSRTYALAEDLESKIVEVYNMSEDTMMYPGKMLGQLAIALEKMGWEYGDNIDVEIGGTSLYQSIHQWRRV